MKKWSIFLTIFFFSIFVCTLKYVNMIRISNISCFRFCWNNEKLDWPKCARTTEGPCTVRPIYFFIFPKKTEKGHITYPYHICIFQSTEKKEKKRKWLRQSIIFFIFLILKLNSKIQKILLTAKSDILLFLFSWYC